LLIFPVTYINTANDELPIDNSSGGYKNLVLGYYKLEHWMQLQTLQYFFTILTLVIVVTSFLLLLCSMLTSNTYSLRHRAAKKIALMILPLSAVSISALPFSDVLENYLQRQDQSQSITIDFIKKHNGHLALKVRYPNGKSIKLNRWQAIVLPDNANIDVTLNDKYRASSWWWNPAREFQMNLPGNKRELWLHTSHSGNYTSKCGSLCGDLFANKTLKIVTEPEKKYDIWLRHLPKKTSISS
jgi:heme/copper-type cytochrome/quinol oxidase subunit 2